MLKITALEILAGVIVTLIIASSAALSVETFSFVYQGF
jgi:Na+/phosphate symporter